MLVMCSRNARPEKGLVRRPHADQHGCPLPRMKRKQALKGQKGQLDGGSSFDARSKGQPRPLPIKRDM